MKTQQTHRPFADPSKLGSALKLYPELTNTAQAETGTHTRKPILDALLNASESFAGAEPCWCGNPDRNHAPEQPTHSVLQGKDLVKELIKRVQIQADKTEDEWENLEAERDQYKAHADRLAEALKTVDYAWTHSHGKPIGYEVIKMAREALAQWEQQ